jgi:Protein of unknown function (DUF 659)
MGKIQTSPIHNYYHAVVLPSGRNKRQCNDKTCNMQYSLTTGNGSLVAHLKVRHPIAFGEYCDLVKEDPINNVIGPSINNSSTSTPHGTDSGTDILSSASNAVPIVSSPITIDLSSSDSYDNTCSTSAITSTSSPKSVITTTTTRKKRKPTTMIEHCRYFGNPTLAKTFARFFAIHSLPQSLIESPILDQLVREIRSSNCDLPSIAKLISSQDDVYNDMRKTVIDFLAESKVSPSFIAFDGWTNVNHDKITTMVVAKEGRAYYWTSFNNKSHPNTALNLYPIIRDEMKFLISKGINIVAAVADNEPLNTAIINLLRSDIPFFFHIPCGAHTLNLSCQ